MLNYLTELARHYFIPQHTNNYRAKAIHHHALVFYIIFLFAFQSINLFVKKIHPDILGYATDITIDKIINLVNLERQKASLDPLSLSPELSEAAKNKGSDMFSKNYWAHISPTGITPWEFITDSGYQYIFAGEKLAKSFDNSEEVVAAWMKSPTHRANILKSEYTEIGIAVKNGRLNGEETTLVVQEFGSRVKPVSARIDESIVDNSQSGETPQIISQSEGRDQVKKSFLPLRINRTVSLLIAEFMLVVLLIDSIFIWKNKTVRISGHSLAHIMFLLALLGAMSATGVGAIL